MDPIDWAAWLYGKMGHAGFFVVAVVVLLIIAGIWVRGSERYREERQAKGYVDPPSVSAPTREIAGADPKPTTPIVWNFESEATFNSPYFLGLTGSEGKELQVANFHARGINATNEPIRNAKAFIRSDVTNVEIPVRFNVSGQLFDLNDTAGIPVGASFDVSTGLFSEYIPVSRFLIDFAPFTFVFSYGDKTYRRQFSIEECQKVVTAVERARIAARAPRSSVRPKTEPPPPIKKQEPAHKEELPIELKWGGSMKFKAISSSPDMLSAVKCILVDARRFVPHTGWVQTSETHSGNTFKTQLETGQMDMYCQQSVGLGSLANENFRVSIQGNTVGGGGGLDHCRITTAGTWRLYFQLEDARGHTVQRSLCFRWPGEGHAPEALDCADIGGLPPPLHTESLGR